MGCLYEPHTVDRQVFGCLFLAHGVRRVEQQAAKTQERSWSSWDASIVFFGSGRSFPTCKRGCLPRAIPTPRGELPDCAPDRRAGVQPTGNFGLADLRSPPDPTFWAEQNTAPLYESMDMTAGSHT